MSELILFARNNISFTLALFILNTILSGLVSSRLYIRINGHIVDATGGRIIASTFYRRYLRYSNALKHYFKRIPVSLTEKRIFPKLYEKASDTVKKCGGNPESIAVYIFMFLKYVLPFMVGVIVFLLNLNIMPAILATLLVILLVRYGIWYLRNMREQEFKRSAYKIYRFLHNQISAGVNVTDAVKTVYRVVDDSKLKDNLILLSARYARTLDMDSALEGFRANYGLQEVDSLCVALKQGIQTGDNKDLLQRQEQLMFKQYFNYVQAETDMCRLKSTVIVVLLMLIVIIMVLVPMFSDIRDAVGNILVN